MSRFQVLVNNKPKDFVNFEKSRDYCAFILSKFDNQFNMYQLGVSKVLKSLRLF